MPDRVLVDPFLDLEDDWETLQIPVRLAFLFHSSPTSRWVAVYPGAVGATESELPLDAWDDVVTKTPLLQAMEPDVEALLVHGERGEALESFLVPIDVCYRLVALVREHWQGFDGGHAFRRELSTFLGELRARSRTLDLLS